MHIYNSVRTYIRGVHSTNGTKFKCHIFSFIRDLLKRKNLKGYNEKDFFNFILSAENPRFFGMYGSH